MCGSIVLCTGLWISGTACQVILLMLSIPVFKHKLEFVDFEFVIRREQKMNVSIFRRSCVVVVSQSNRTQIVISITSVVVESVVISSYRSRIVVELESQCVT